MIDIVFVNLEHRSGSSDWSKQRARWSTVPRIGELVMMDEVIYSVKDVRHEDKLGGPVLCAHRVRVYLELVKR